MVNRASFVVGVFVFLACLAGCAGPQGPEGEKGEPGAPGTPGAKGDPGKPGTNGVNGTNGTNGIDGQSAALSGSRLKAIWLSGDDGSSQFYGWQDSALGNAYCKFQFFQGALRCVPDSRLYNTYNANCAALIAEDGAVFVTDGVPDTLYQVKGDDIYSDSTIYVKTSGGGCVQKSSPCVDCYRFVQPVDASNFVSGTLSPVSENYL